MKYTIDWIERGTTSTGKVKADATISDHLTGEKTDVTIWGDFPNFAGLMPGMTIEADLKPASDPKYKPSLNAPRLPKSAVSGGFKAAQIEKAVDYKDNKIGGRMEQKEESIKMAGAQRDAVLIVTTFYKERWAGDTVIHESSMLDEMIKKKVMEFRDYFLSHEFNETLPF